MSNTIQMLRTDDWVVLYVNGKKATEGHSVSAADLLAFANIEYSERWLENADQLSDDANDGTAYAVENYFLSGAPESWDQVERDVA